VNSALRASGFQSSLRDSETLPAPYPALRAGLLSDVLRTTIVPRAFSRSCGTPRRCLLLTRHCVPGYFRTSFGRRSCLGLSVVPPGLRGCDGTFTRHFVPGYFRSSFGRRSWLALSVVPAGLRDVTCSLPGTSCRATFGRPSDDDRGSGFQSSLRDSRFVTVHLPGTSCRATFGRPSDDDRASGYQSSLPDPRVVTVQ
jgi:hypothetical protein